MKRILLLTTLCVSWGVHAQEFDRHFADSTLRVDYVFCGEAVVFPHKAPAHFFTTIKQHGALQDRHRENLREAGPAAVHPGSRGEGRQAVHYILPGKWQV